MEWKVVSRIFKSFCYTSKDDITYNFKSQKTFCFLWLVSFVLNTI